MKLLLTLNVFSLAGLAVGIGQQSISCHFGEHAERTGMTSGERGGDRERGDGGGEMGRDPNQNPTLQEQMIKSDRFFPREESALGCHCCQLSLRAAVPLVGGFISLLFNELILTISFAVAASLSSPSLWCQCLLVYSLFLGQVVSEFWLLRQFNRRFEDATRGYGGFKDGSPLSVTRSRDYFYCLSQWVY